MHFNSLIILEDTEFLPNVEPFDYKIKENIINNFKIKIKEYKENNINKYELDSFINSQMNYLRDDFTIGICDIVDVILDPYCVENNCEFVDYTSVVVNNFNDLSKKYYFKFSNGSFYECYRNPDNEIMCYTLSTVSSSSSSLKFLQKSSVYKLINNKVYKANKKGLFVRTKNSKKIKVLYGTNKEIFKTFKKYCKFIDDNHYYDKNPENPKQYGFYENENGMYDWYDIGGRWNDKFIVRKEDDRFSSINQYQYWMLSYISDKIFDLDNNLKISNDYRFTPVARVKDICFDEMYKLYYNEFKKEYDHYIDMIEKNKQNCDNVNKYITIEDGKIISDNNKIIFDSKISCDEFINNHLSNDNIFESVFDDYGIKQSEPIKLSKLKHIIDNTNPESILVSIDFHI